MLGLITFVILIYLSIGLVFSPMMEKAAAEKG